MSTIQASSLGRSAVSMLSHRHSCGVWRNTKSNIHQLGRVYRFSTRSLSSGSGVTDISIINGSRTTSTTLGLGQCQPSGLLHKSQCFGHLKNPHIGTGLILSRVSLVQALHFSSKPCNMMDKEFWVDYTPPDWAKHLKNAPSKKLKLANIPTPIHRWYLPGLPEDVEVYMKRDDMTGSTLSGNKVRKLEFLLADAVTHGCRHVITCGGVQSNHCRAVAVACAQLGLQCHLMLRGDVQDVEDVENNGNVLLDKLCGAKLYFVPRKSPYETHLKPRMEALADSIESTSGEKSYLIPVGGSNPVGVWGYISAFNEMLEQNVAQRFDDIVFACGSGGTAEGLAFGNYLSKSDLKIHGIAVSDDARYFNSLVNDTMEFFGMNHISSEDILDIVEGYKGLGYGISRKEELDFSAEVARATGIITDPVYTGKAVYGLVKELQQNPSRFKGKRILFIHTGGVFGMYDGKLGDWLKSDPVSTRQMYQWTDLSDPVPI